MKRSYQIANQKEDASVDGYLPGPDSFRGNEQDSGSEVQFPSGSPGALIRPSSLAGKTPRQPPRSEPKALLRKATTARQRRSHAFTHAEAGGLPRVNAGVTPLPVAISECHHIMREDAIQRPRSAVQHPYSRSSWCATIKGALIRINMIRLSVDSLVFPRKILIVVGSYGCPFCFTRLERWAGYPKWSIDERSLTAHLTQCHTSDIQGKLLVLLKADRVLGLPNKIEALLEQPSGTHVNCPRCSLSFQQDHSLVKHILNHRLITLPHNWFSGVEVPDRMSVLNKIWSLHDQVDEETWERLAGNPLGFDIIRKSIDEAQKRRNQTYLTHTLTEAI
ncbi:unnamed protein product [Clonostachys chloroleuca]|uniref:C2H2-type domain-containing protein n=1 Tax=Clonostachys chloroleuca TaxID=1926264 RepID=A0AA35LQG8_9HYPO|nr:unnamed protein product [Clonostachys chloroleuca]